MEKKNWYVANDDGEIIGHDMSEVSAKLLASEMRADDPDANWEALNEED